MADDKEKIYKQLDEDEFYNTGTGRGVIKVSEEENSKNRTVLFAKEVKSGSKWVPRKNGFFAVSFEHVGKIIDSLIKFTGKFGWTVSSLDKPENQVKDLKKQLDETLQQKDDFQKRVKNLEKEIEDYKVNLVNLRKQIIETNASMFRQDIQDLEKLLVDCETGAKKEEDIQKFLTEKTWIFSPEYHNVRPKPPVGSKSIFDFYLEDYKGQGTIIELKLPSELIFGDETYGFSPKTGNALGQLMRYIETTIATSHSKELSIIEGVDEIRPLGFLIIGRSKTKEEIERIKITNSYLHCIQILSYDMLLLRAKSFSKWLEK